MAKASSFCLSPSQAQKASKVVQTAASQKTVAPTNVSVTELSAAELFLMPKKQPLVPTLTESHEKPELTPNSSAARQKWNGRTCSVAEGTLEVRQLLNM